MFKKIFRNKRTEELNHEFEKEFHDAVKRYIGSPHSKMIYETKDKKGNVIPASIHLKETYNEWKILKSTWDRRLCIFSALDKFLIDQIPNHQIIERLIIAGLPENALIFSKKHSSPQDLEDNDFLASLSKCHFFLSNYNKSIELAKRVLAIEKDNKKAQIVLADSFYLTDQQTKANEIYNRIIRQSKLKDFSEKNIDIIEATSFYSDILHSSIYAVNLLLEQNSDETVWNKISNEFYYCPYFRSQHAYKILRKREKFNGLGMLYSTTIHFPWYKDAVINARNIMLNFRKNTGSNDLFEKEVSYLSELIKKNNW